MKVLESNIHQAEVKIDGMKREIGNLKRQQSYKDQERDKDIAEKLEGRLEDEILRLKEL